MVLDWMEVATDVLRGIGAVDTSLENLPELIEAQEAAISRIRTSDPERAVGGNGDGDAMLGAIIYRDELQLRLLEARKLSGAVHRALDALNDKEAYVLEQLLIKRRPVEALCQEYSVEPNTVYRWKRTALELFTRNLYGCK